MGAERAMAALGCQPRRRGQPSQRHVVERKTARARGERAGACRTAAARAGAGDTGPQRRDTRHPPGRWALCDIRGHQPMVPSATGSSAALSRYRGSDADCGWCGSTGDNARRLRLRLGFCAAACQPAGAFTRTQVARSCEMVLKIERFQPEGMNVRMSAGKPSYSHVVTVSGTGKLVYTAGQLARDIDGNCVGKGDMRAQMEQTFQNLDRCLKAAGATWADVVKTNTFVTDFDEFQKCADVRMRYLGVATPTSTTVGVTRLAGPDFMIEIEAVAVVNE